MSVKIDKLADGKVHVEYETGEVFDGDPLEVTERIANSHIETKRWSQGIKAENERLKAEAVSQPQTPTDYEAERTQRWVADNAFAGAKLGSVDEVQSEWLKQKAFREEAEAFIASQKLKSAGEQFITKHPEFPGTEQSIAVVDKIFAENGWSNVTPGNLEAAHLIAMERRKEDPSYGYQPLSVEEQAKVQGTNAFPRTSNPQAPPMLRTNNPEISSGAPDVYKMPLADLRNAAIQQELGRK